MYDQNYLAHHGIKGQKWGVRKYQNSDGSLTDEGRKRYGVGERIKNKYNSLNPKTKTAIKVGAGIAAAALAAYGAYKIGNTVAGSNKSKSSDSSTQTVKDFLGSYNAKTNESSSGSKKTWREDVKDNVRRWMGRKYADRQTEKVSGKRALPFETQSTKKQNDYIESVYSNKRAKQYAKEEIDAAMRRYAESTSSSIKALPAKRGVGLNDIQARKRDVKTKTRGVDWYQTEIQRNIDRLNGPRDRLARRNLDTYRKDYEDSMNALRESRQKLADMKKEYRERLRHTGILGYYWRRKNII